MWSSLWNIIAKPDKALHPSAKVNLNLVLFLIAYLDPKDFHNPWSLEIHRINFTPAAPPNQLSSGSRVRPG